MVCGLTDKGIVAVPRTYTSRPIEERFWEKVDTSGECWVWTANRDKDGYGRIGRIRAHRFSYELHNGSIPSGAWVLHHCDNPPCVNPVHLYAGTVTDNNRDTVRRGHHVNAPPVLRGEQNPRARLSEQQVMEIRTRRAAGEMGIDLAAEFGVSDRTISMVYLGRVWKSCAGWNAE